MSANLASKVKLLSKLENKSYRHAYVAEHIKTIVPYQCRALRDERDWSQADLGKEAGKPQNVISRLENPSSGYPSIKTLLELAYAFDVALVIKFVPFSRFVKEFDDVSPVALSAREFERDRKALEKWATESVKASQPHVEEETSRTVVPFRYESPALGKSQMGGPSISQSKVSGISGRVVPTTQRKLG